ncbi:hypothetical protein PVAG01_04050 [Phlyctema vagabunda]|uniref:Uncharacterized protein n=1 Tax=Phlyctema vagabunda TaxID=108571 RepID=A0ABR4PN60_9HELO
MGELQNRVSSLLEAFSQGKEILKVQRWRRKENRRAIDVKQKGAETKLSKSLGKDRLQVKDAYGKDLSRYGHDFAAGDAEAQSSLSAILFRLNAGLVSVIEMFTRGRSSSADYQRLLNLSNTSRIEAIKTFSELSSRLSRSSLDLAPVNKHSTSTSRNKRKHKSSKSFGKDSSSNKRSRSRNVPDLSITALGPANSDGWIRPKAGRKSSSNSTPKHSSRSVTPRQSRSKNHTQALQQAVASPVPVLPPVENEPIPKARARARMDNCKSIMSIASGSTKIGEIPEYKWIKPSFDMAESTNYPVTVFYPTGIYEEPSKPRSRLARLFRR